VDGRTSLSSNMMKNTIKSPCPWCERPPPPRGVATDAVYASARRRFWGASPLPVLLDESLVKSAFPMKSDKQFVNTPGHHSQIWCHGQAHQRQCKGRDQYRVKDVMRAMVIDDWRPRHTYQHQNFSERGYRDVKARVNLILNLWC
jgi:hypothetical protein